MKEVWNRDFLKGDTFTIERCENKEKETMEWTKVNSLDDLPKNELFIGWYEGKIAFCERYDENFLNIKGLYEFTEAIPQIPSTINHLTHYMKIETPNEDGKVEVFPNQPPAT